MPTITVVATATGATVDVRIDAGAGTRVADVLPRLHELTAATAGAVRRNGVRLDVRTPVSELVDGDLLELYDDNEPAEPSPARRSTDAGDDRQAVVNRPPRRPAPPTPPRVVFPAAPQAPSPARLSLTAAFAPVAVGVGVTLLMRRWEFLAFAAMSPVTLLAQAAGDRWSARRAHARSLRAHAAALTDAEQRLAAALADERREREAVAPGVTATVAAARHRSALLWHRGLDDDVLRLRVGIGPVPAAVGVEGRPAPVLEAAPVLLDLHPGQVVGICGADVSADVARSLVLQAVALHGPSTLAVTVLAPGRGQRWAWTRWLPHLRSPDLASAALAVDDEQVARRLDELRAPEPRHRLVVVDGARDRAVAAALTRLPRTSVLWLDQSAATLPTECSAVVTAEAGPQPRVVLRAGAAAATPVLPDLAAPHLAEAAARALAPLRDTEASAALPGCVRWSELYDVRLGDVDQAAAQLLRRWRHGPTTAVRLGRAAHGCVVVDLQSDGPHMLVAGTTGAGKSELLQSLVAGLVAGNSPTDLSLLLVDYKGGAAFGPCTRFPHTVGVLTDLDAATTARALQSLTAELRRRERVLAAAGAPDLDALRRRDDRTVDLPRLVIVVDEFAALCEELPEFVGGLVGLARRGRSLGVHLVLATQRPEGAVSADIRANARLRICLAVTRETESRDVIDSPRAAAIAATTPGRALVRIDARDLVEVQVARVAVPHPQRQRQRGDVTVLALRDWGEPAEAPTADAPTELELLADAATAAARAAELRRPAPPWLPPLPDRVRLSELPDVGADVAVGLVDAPQRLRQPPLVLDAAAAEPLLLVGAARSGRTTGALAVAVALAARSAPDQLHIWAVDHAAGLADLRRLPHTGAVIDARDSDCVERLVGYLTAEVRRRRGQTQPPLPQLLLIVDGWETLVAGSDADGGRCLDALLRLVTDGASGGLRVVVTSDRSGLSGRLATAVADKVCLRLADRGDYALAGVAPRIVPTALPAGRGIRVRDGALVQLAVPDDSAWSRASDQPAAATRPRRFERLPERVPLAAVPRPQPPRLVVGIRGDDLAPVSLAPADIGGAFLVAGPPRSGRSTVLLSLAAQMPAQRVVAICGRNSPLRRRSEVTVVDAADADDLAHTLATDAVLLVDDVDLVDDPQLLASIESAIRAARDGTGLVVLAGATDAMTASFRGPVAQARRARAGLLLHPAGPHDGELLGLRLRRRDPTADPPGRGILALHGRSVTVQVPCAD